MAHKGIKKLNWLILVFLVIGLLVTARMKSTLDSPGDVAAPAQDFAFTDLEGKSYRLHDFKSRTVIVHFWATWCMPCLKELPVLLQRVAEDPELTLIAFSVDKKKEYMTQFLQVIGIHSPRILHVWDPNFTVAQREFNVAAYPESFILDAEMLLVTHIAGVADWSQLP